VNSARLFILKEAKEVRLGRLLQSEISRSLKAWCVGVSLRDFSRKSLKGEVDAQKLPGALKLVDVAQGDRARPVAALDSGLATGLGLFFSPAGSQRQSTRRLAASRAPHRVPGPRHRCGRQVC